MRNGLRNQERLFISSHRVRETLHRMQSRSRIMPDGSNDVQYFVPWERFLCLRHKSRGILLSPGNEPFCPLSPRGEGEKCFHPSPRPVIGKYTRPCTFHRSPRSIHPARADRLFPKTKRRLEDCSRHLAIEFSICPHWMTSKKRMSGFVPISTGRP